MSRGMQEANARELRRGAMPKHSARKTKGTGKKAGEPGLRDLEARKTNAPKGGLGNVNRFDPYRSYRFR